MAMRDFQNAMHTNREKGREKLGTPIGAFDFFGDIHCKLKSHFVRQIKCHYVHCFHCCALISLLCTAITAGLLWPAAAELKYFVG
jgi:hypothetical protein